jgi:hypothetical protein
MGWNDRWEQGGVEGMTTYQALLHSVKSKLKV